MYFDSFGHSPVDLDNVFLANYFVRSGERTGQIGQTVCGQGGGWTRKSLSLFVVYLSHILEEEEDGAQEKAAENQGQCQTQEQHSATD